MDNIKIVTNCFSKFFIKGISCHSLSTPSRVDTNGELLTVRVSPLSALIPIAPDTNFSISAIFSGANGWPSSMPVSGLIATFSLRSTAAVIFIMVLEGFCVVEMVLLTSKFSISLEDWVLIRSSPVFSAGEVLNSA